MQMGPLLNSLCEANVGPTSRLHVRVQVWKSVVSWPIQIYRPPTHSDDGGEVYGLGGGLDKKQGKGDLGIEVKSRTMVPSMFASFASDLQQHTHYMQ